MILPVIIITMGDASGIGPEIIAKAMARPELSDLAKVLVVGDARRLRQAAAITNSGITVRVIADPAEARHEQGVVDCIDVPVIPEGHPFGVVSPVSGEGAYRFVKKAMEFVLAGKAQAICTAPLNKAALHAAGHIYPGHTELLAHLANTPEVSMMLMTPALRVVHVTTHLGLIDAVNKIEPGLVERTIVRAHDTLIHAGIADPRIAVCGINPHAGENGLFGNREEETKILPAIETLRARGWRVDGPLPADTAFFRAGRGDFDAVIAMYHDQGHTPIKVLGIADGVNITIGLPVIRTSVDHGTAFDIAGQGIASEDSLMEALRQAAALSARAGASS